jgi:hypothetical protein
MRMESRGLFFSVAKKEEKLIATDLSNILAALPDEALIPVSWIRARLAAPLPVETVGDLSCSDVAEALKRRPRHDPWMVCSWGDRRRVPSEWKRVENPESESAGVPRQAE